MIRTKEIGRSCGGGVGGRSGCKSARKTGCQHPTPTNRFQMHSRLENLNLSIDNEPQTAAAEASLRASGLSAAALSTSACNCPYTSPTHMQASTGGILKSSVSAFICHPAAGCSPDKCVFPQQAGRHEGGARQTLQRSCYSCEHVTGRDAHTRYPCHSSINLF